MEITKQIVINGLPLSYHKINLMEVDLDLAAVKLTVKSWFSKESADNGLPPHWVHAIYSVGDSTELAAVLIRGLDGSILENALLAENIDS